jgi:hypothetical protein
MKTLLSAFITLAILVGAMALASAEDGSHLSTQGQDRRHQGARPGAARGRACFMGRIPGLGASRSKGLRDYTAMTGSSASSWGDDGQSLPLFSGFMNPPPAYAPSPYLSAAV